MTPISRRALLRATLASAGAAVLFGSWRRGRGMAQGALGALRLPLIVTWPAPTPTPAPTPPPSPTPSVTPNVGPSPTVVPMDLRGRVVHAHASTATFWDYGNSYYGDYVNQDVVDAMLDAAVVALTGRDSVAAAWRAIVPDYVPGRGIAIKLNLNNTYHCDLPRTRCEEWQLVLDAVVHPVNAIVSGLHRAYPAFDERDVWVYDGTIGTNPPVSNRRIPARLIAGCRYPGVRFFDTGCAEPVTYDVSSPGALISWRPPDSVPAPPAMAVADVLVRATYVINVPIMRRHVSAGVTLGFKNHLGSVDDPASLHAWVCRDGAHLAGPAYSPLVDLYRNPHIGPKTVLVLGDGLYGNWDNNITKAAPWRTFGGQAANSLFVATDPVAIDCVMTDFLHAESPVWDMADLYLQAAASAGLGVFERGDPWNAGYGAIAYSRLEV